MRSYLSVRVCNVMIRSWMRIVASGENGWECDKYVSTRRWWSRSEMSPDSLLGMSSTTDRDSINASLLGKKTSQHWIHDFVYILIHWTVEEDDSNQSSPSYVPKLAPKDRLSSSVSTVRRRGRRRTETVQERERVLWQFDGVWFS